MNARGIINKVLEFARISFTYDIYIVVITKTWITSNILNKNILPPGYELINKDSQTVGGCVDIVLIFGIRFVEMK